RGILDGVNAVIQVLQRLTLTVILGPKFLVLALGAQMCDLLGQPIKAVHQCTEHHEQACGRGFEPTLMNADSANVGPGSGCTSNYERIEAVVSGHHSAPVDRFASW